MDDLDALLELNDKRSVMRHHDGKTRLGWGVNMNDIMKAKEIFIKDSERSGHFGCFGTTRIGK